MLPKIATLSESRFSLEKRSAKRRSIKLGFDTPEQQAKTRVLILDLSRSGMRIKTSARFEVGERLELEVPEAGPVSATIVREISDEFGNEFGAAFDEPITEGAVSAVLLAAPPFAPPIPQEDKDQWIREARARHPEVQPVSDIFLGVLLVLVTLIVGGFVYAIGFLPLSG